MQTAAAHNSFRLDFRYLPEYVAYILDNCYDGFIREQLRLSREYEVPLLSLLSHLNEKELFEFAEKSTRETLELLASNQAARQIEISNSKWLNNQIPSIQKEDIVIEDIFTILHVRKLAFVKFLPGYTENVEDWLHIIREIDEFNLQSQLAGSKSYIGLLLNKEKSISDELTKSREQLLEAQELSEMGSFEWDPESHEASVTPKVMKILEMNEHAGMDQFMQRVHPTDRARIQNAIAKAINETGVYECEYRFAGSEKEKVIWSRGLLVNRNGKRVMVGTIMDVTDRYHMIQKLQRSEELYKQAQALTHIGNYLWDLRTQKLQWSDELFRIYALEPQSVVPDYDMIYAYNHPDDRETVSNKTQEAIANRTGFDFLYRIILPDRSVKHLHARGEIMVDDLTGEPYKVIGTAEDITERQLLMARLKQEEEIYKQSELLAKIGNWKWNIITGEVEWTDELYRIYGLEPQSEKVSLERFKSFIHPDFKELVETGIRNALIQHRQDYTFKIIAADGTVKSIRSIARITVNEKGEPVSAIGTEQDVTEKEELIARLQESENLYRQAQALSKLGSWKLDLQTGKLECSEEMYRIYELDPESDELSREFVAKFRHEAEKAEIDKKVEKAIDKIEPYEFVYTITTQAGLEKILRAKGEPVSDKNGQVVSLFGTVQDITEKQRMIARLEESEDLYKQAQSLSHIGNWSWNVAENRVNWSDELYRIFGLEPGEAIDYERYVSLLYPDDVKLVTSSVEAALKEKKPYEFYHRLQLKDGSIRTLHSLGNPLVDKDGNVYKLVGTAQDVTEQKRTEEQLIENQNFVKKVADATPSIIASYNINTGKYRFVSEGLEKLLGYSPELPMKEGIAFFMPLIHPEDAQELLQKNAQALELANSSGGIDKEVIIEFEYRMKHRDGEYRWFHTYGTVFDRNAEGKVEHILNISLDITESKNAEQKIREQEHFIQHIADASPTILYLYNVRDNHIEYINQEISFVTGYTPEEILQMGTAFRHDMYHPEDQIRLPERNDGYNDLAKDEDSMFQYECRMRSKHNTAWRWLLVREVIFRRDEKNNPLQVLGAAIDISERREIELTLQQKNLELEQSNTSLEEFAYVASHDLQEPLRKISVFGDKLNAEKEALRADQKTYLEKIIDSSVRMQKLIDDLLIISRISHDKSFVEYSLQSVFNETIQLLEHKIENKKAVIRADKLPTANIIPAQFRQLFQNLLSNSLKFVDDEKVPEIQISWKYLTPKEATIYNVAPGKRYLHINFKDNGIGFENEYASRIFVIFQRLHGRAEYEGTGIGLAICKKIIENHGGAIQAKSEAGKGATFTIVFPA